MIKEADIFSEEGLSAIKEAGKRLSSCSDITPINPLRCEDFKAREKVLIITSDTSHPDVYARMVKLANEDIDIIVMHPDDANSVFHFDTAEAYNAMVGMYKSIEIYAESFKGMTINFDTEAIRQKALDDLSKIRQSFKDLEEVQKPSPIPPKMSARQFGKVTQALAFTALTGRRARRDRRKRGRS